MRLSLTNKFAALLAGLALAGPMPQPVRSAPLPAAAAEAPGGPQRLEQAIYDGWRASKLLGSAVFSQKGEYLGEVRNAILDDGGHIRFVVVQGAAAGKEPEFVFRIPWARLVRPPHPGALIADFSDLQSRQYGLFFDPDQQPHDSDFRISRVIGDDARLQTGQGFGYVSDLVFGEGGRLLAVLISRDASGGGGIFAFPWPGATGKWSAAMSYYGLPYVTDEQARQAGLRVDLGRFNRQS